MIHLDGRVSRGWAIRTLLKPIGQARAYLVISGVAHLLFLTRVDGQQVQRGFLGAIHPQQLVHEAVKEGGQPGGLGRQVDVLPLLTRGDFPVAVLSDCGIINPVNQSNDAYEDVRRPMGALACIVTGFEVVARRPTLIILPLALDLWLWLGPRLSIAPVLQEMKQFIHQMTLLDPDAAGMAESLAMMSQVLDELSSGFNLFAALNPGPLLGVPVLMPVRLGGQTPWGVQPTLTVGSTGLIVLLSVLLALVGLGLNALYLHNVGRAVLDETAAELPGPEDVFTLWRKFVRLGVGLLVVGLIFSVALSLFVTLLGLINLAIAGLALTLFSAMGIFILFHLVFTVPGMVQMRRGVVEAVRESMLLARGDFLQAMLLLGLILVVTQGLNVVWTLPTTDSWATAVGLAGHAFVSTAVTAALFIFYQERLEFLRALVHFLSGQRNDLQVPSGVSKAECTECPGSDQG